MLEWTKLLAMLQADDSYYSALPCSASFISLHWDSLLCTVLRFEIWGAMRTLEDNLSCELPVAD